MCCVFAVSSLRHACCDKSNLNGEHFKVVTNINYLQLTDCILYHSEWRTVALT